MGMGFLLGVMNMFWELDHGWLHNLVSILKATELCTLKMVNFKV